MNTIINVRNTTRAIKGVNISKDFIKAFKKSVLI
jgi:hypothetical protein